MSTKMPKDIKRYQAVIKEREKVQYAEERQSASKLISNFHHFPGQTLFQKISTL